MALHNVDDLSHLELSSSFGQETASTYTDRGVCTPHTHAAVLLEEHLCCQRLQRLVQQGQVDGLWLGSLIRQGMHKYNDPLT